MLQELRWKPATMTMLRHRPLMIPTSLKEAVRWSAVHPERPLQSERGPRHHQPRHVLRWTRCWCRCSDLRAPPDLSHSDGA
jgi:hypothetical protein